MVATPIGNLGDISERTKQVLSSVSFVICEDTRVTRKLIQSLGIKKELVSLHHHSSDNYVTSMALRIKSGESAAYVSDAGTPGLADPGGLLVKAAVKEKVKVVPIPGPSAVTAILSVAGVPANSYTFMGYPPHKKGRQKFFKTVADCEHTVVFFESTHRIMKMLAELGSVIGERPIVVGRELTKMYESIYRGTTALVAEEIAESSTKGEFVVVVTPQ